MIKYIPVISYKLGPSRGKHRLPAENSLQDACYAASCILVTGIWTPNENNDVWTLISPDAIYKANVLMECDDDD